jgi:hypothetical protein
LLKPLAVISLIPLSFIGVFLTFYLFGFNFDQGGFASFILLSGLVPFVWGGQNEVFWFAFATGAMGGLIFSLVAQLLSQISIANLL